MRDKVRTMDKAESLIPTERIAGRILMIRGEKVMLDEDLAVLYGLETKNLNKAVTRNPRRFPEDFMFRLTRKEWDALRFHFGTSSQSHGGRRYLPRVFSEQGVAMLSSVLRSDRAADVNVAIMCTFVRLRKVLATNEQLARKVAQHDRRIGVLFEQVRTLPGPTDPPRKNPIGFQSDAGN